MSITLRCPHCQITLQIAATYPAGTVLTCAACKKPFRLAGPPPPPPPEVVLDVLPATAVPRLPPEGQGRPSMPASAPPPVRRQPHHHVPSSSPASEPLLVEPIAAPVPAGIRSPDPAEDVVTPRRLEPGRIRSRLGALKRKWPRFTDDPTAAPRRQRINRAVIVSAIVAAWAATGWLAAFLGLANLFTETSILGILAVVFLGSLFGGMFASSLTGVARFRHSLYAGLGSFGAQLVFSVPLLFLVLWFKSRMSQLASPSVADDPSMNAFDQLQRSLGTLLLCLALDPFLIVTGFLLGGGLDVQMTAAARALSSRERWTYHTRDGKSFPVYGPWRHPILAVFWSTIGWAVLLTCWVPLLAINLLGALAAFALGQACRTLANKYRAVSAKAALEQDQRPPIVYLRSFQDDGPFQPGTFFLLNDWLRTLREKTAEEQLASALAPFGPVVAIGRPEEEMPEVGAARIYVGDDHWQDLIADLLNDRDSLAVFQAGDTKGLRWELETIAAKLRPEQVLIFLPFALHWSYGRRDAGYTAFRAWANECFPAELPAAIKNQVYFFYFTSTPAWKTRVVEPQVRIPQAHPLNAVLKDLESSKSLQPWRLMNLRRFFKLLLAGVILTIISSCAGFFWHPKKDSASSTSAETLETKWNDQAANDRLQPPAVPAVPPKADTITYQGRAMPYKIRLSKRWKEVAQPGKADRKFDIGDGSNLNILVPGKALNPDRYSADFVTGLKESLQNVEVLTERRIERKGQTWLEMKARFTAEEETGWLYMRVWSGTKQSVVLIAVTAKDDEAGRQLVQEGFDGLELPE